MAFFKDKETNAVVFYPRLYNNRYMNGEIDPIEDYDACVAIKSGKVVGEGYAEDLYDDAPDKLFLKEDWYGTAETSSVVEADPILETTPEPEPVAEPSPEVVLPVEPVVTESSISKQDTEELIYDRSNPDPRYIKKRFKLLDEDPLFKWKTPSERQGANSA